MVAITDLKVYKTTNNLGGAITGTQIVSANPNNMFVNVPNNERVIGEDYYGCCYWKNTHATESMDNFKLWLSSKVPPPDTELKWAFDPVATNTGYRWEPYFTGDGATTFDSTASTSALQLTTFSVSAWFKTSASMGSRGYIVNKGGEGSETSGQNDNYSIAMNTNGTIRAGFEEADGTDHYATSPLAYNNGLWHLVFVSYGGNNVNLYVDNMTTPVATHSFTGVPETSGTNPVVVGRNSRSSANFFDGLIDEVNIWGGVKSDESRQALLQNTVSQTNLVYQNKFGADTNTLTAQTITDKYTAPVGVTWNTLGGQPSDPNFGNLLAGRSFPIWLWLHVNANAVSRIDDGALFSFNFNIPQGGTGSGGGGGGTGGNPPPANTDYKIAFAGDWGCEPETDDVIDLIQTQDYDFVVGVGDNAYEGASCWTSKFTPLKSIMESAYGNHEYSESGGVNPYKTFFGHSLTYFTFQFQNIFFLVIDTNINCDPGSNQHDFIVDELARVANDNTITWKIAVMHHPWFGSNSDHSYNEFDQVDAFHELFQNNKVSFVVVGHNHNWQRTHMVAFNESNPESPTIVDNTSPYSRNTVGLIHVISGTGGHDSGGSLYALDSSPSFNAYQNRSNNGVWEIVGSSNGQTLTCSFRNVDGNTSDTFTITA